MSVVRGHPLVKVHGDTYLGIDAISQYVDVASHKFPLSIFKSKAIIGQP